MINRYLRMRSAQGLWRMSSSKMPNNQKMTAHERWKLIEERDRQTNVFILRREIFNDCMQLPLKFLAYTSTSVTNQSTFWAELIRSCIDAVNHMLMFSTSYINFGPSIRFPYGIEKLKNMVVIIPAGLFFYFGIEISFEAIVKVSHYSEAISNAEFNPLSLALYLVSIGIETGIILKNIHDAQKVQDMPSGKNMGFVSQLRKIFQQKDPVLQTILYENAITLSSTLVPIISSLLTLAFPIPVFEIVGSLVIGIIQINLGFHLLQKNLSKLVGEEALDKKSIHHILAIINHNEFVKQVFNFKAVMMGSRNFRVAAEIRFDTERIYDEIMEEYQEKMERIVYIERYSDREEYLEDLLFEVPKRILGHLNQEILNIETNIRNHYPNCIHMDLEINHTQQAALMAKTDQQYNQLYFLTLENISNIPYEKWMQEEADRLIVKFKLNNHSKDKHLKKQDYLKSQDLHRIPTVDPDYHSDEQVLLDDFRFEELKAELSKNLRIL